MSILCLLGCRIPNGNMAPPPAVEQLKTVRAVRMAIDSVGTELLVINGIIVRPSAIDSLPNDEIVALEFVRPAHVSGAVAVITRCPPFVRHRLRFWPDRVERNPACPWTLPPAER